MTPPTHDLLSRLRIDRDAPPPGVRRALARNVVLAAAAVIVVGTAIVLSRSGAAVPVEVVVVSAGQAQGAAAGVASVTANGYVVPPTRASVSAKVAGRLASLLVTGGSFVRPGEVIARLENADYLMKPHAPTAIRLLALLMLPCRTAAAAGEEARDAGQSGLDLRGMLGVGQPAEGDLLPADKAFVLAATSDSPDRITLHWDIADGYYLYRDKTKVAITGGDAALGQPSIPGGEVKHDDYFADQVVFFHRMDADVPVAVASGTRGITLEVRYQGCAEAGLCYPPIRKTVQVQLAAPGLGPTPSGRRVADAGPMRSEQDALADRIRSGSLLAVLGAARETCTDTCPGASRLL